MPLSEQDLVRGSPLEAAVLHVHNAVDGKGLKVFLCRPLDPEDVELKLRTMVGWLQPGNVFMPASGREAAVTNVILLAELLREHIRAGNI